MHREILSGLRGFTENTAFVGGALITWFARPFAEGASPNQWWYPACVFGVFFIASLWLTLAIVKADEAEAARRAADDAKREAALLEIKAAIQAVAAPSNSTPGKAV